jgi:hypothetical protein
MELYPVIAPAAVESIAAGVYRYRPESHRLEALSDDPADYLSVRANTPRRQRDTAG